MMFDYIFGDLITYSFTMDYPRANGFKGLLQLVGEVRK